MFNINYSNNNIPQPHPFFLDLFLYILCDFTIFSKYIHSAHVTITYNFDTIKLHLLWVPKYGRNK